MKTFYKLVPLVILLVAIVGFLAPILISAKSGIAVGLGVLLILSVPALILGYNKLFFKKGSN